MAKRLTVAQVAERLGVSSEVARGMVGLFVVKGIITPAGMKPLKIGRAANVYEFPDGYEQRALELLLAADLAG